MAEDDNRFQVVAFFDAPVNLPMRQLLDRSPQLRVQLIRVMASSWPTKREKNSVGPNPVRNAAAALKSWTSSVIKTVAHENKEVICLYIDARIEELKVKKALVGFGAMVELISRKVVQDLNI